ncbi:MAG: type II secretion system secretin GspD [Steroidobacteraceae bacterium]
MNSRPLRILMLSAALACSGAATAQQGPAITPNYKDADLGQVIEAVAQVTRKNFIVDPRVRAQVTMLSTTPMSPAAFYEAFLAILQVHGFVAVPSGDVIKILPDANARQMPANDLPDSVSSTSDEIVTQIVLLRNVSAAQLVPILRPLIPQYGHLAAHPASNMLIISDRAANVNRMVRIIERIDQAGDQEIDVIRLEHASSAEIVRVINALAPTISEGGAPQVVADERTNSVLLSGEGSQRLRIKTLIAHLDTPLEAGGDTQVRYLRYADAEKISVKLKEQAQGAAMAAAGGGQAGASAAAGADRSINIWAEPDTNALVVTAPPKIMRSLMQVVDRLDIRRAQVMIEAMLVEVSTDAARDLGVNWVIDGSKDNFLVGLFNQPIAGVSLSDVAAGVGAVESGNIATAAAAAPGGFTVAAGRVQDSGTNFAAILRALSSDGDTNVVSMPSVITLDNEEAEIKVAQEVPFKTGSFSNTGSNIPGVNPFTTIERKEVGNILKITPQITDEDTILLKIEQESSGIAAAAAQVSNEDLITNKRTITTRVLVDDGGMIVLGGLIEDRLTDSQSRVPLLGSIPLVGELFKSRSVKKTKTNLMVFIRPRVIRDAQQAAFETNAKYRFIRDLQMDRGGVSLMPSEAQPLLPELPAAPTEGMESMTEAGQPEQ